MPRTVFSTCLPWLLVIALAFVLPSLAHGQDWVTFADESATRISADTSVGLTDTFEKDLFAADVDRDGDKDLLIARKQRFSTPGGRRNVLFMNELGVMVDRTATLAPDFLDLTDDRDLVAVDVDGDGWLDIVTVTTFSEQPRILMNLGRDLAGTWLGFDYEPTDNRLPTFVPGPKFCAVGFGDVTGDEAVDLFFIDYDNTLEDRLLINDGSGFFTDQTDTRMTPAMSASVFGTDAHILDVDNDEDLDIIKNSASGSTFLDSDVRILYNDGTGNFTDMDLIYELAPYMIEPADWNQDGWIDIYVVDDAQDRYLVNTGRDPITGRAEFDTNVVSNSPNTAGFGGNTKIADLDADGLLDILVTDVDTDIPGCGRQMTVLRGQGTPPNVTYSDPFSGAQRGWLPNGSFDVEIFDIDKDGNLDLWIGICDGNMVQINTSGPGIFIGDFEDGLGRWSGSVGAP